MNDVVARTLALIGRHRAMFFVTIALLVGFGTIADTWLARAVSATNIVSSIASFVALGFVTRDVLRREGLAAADSGLRYAALFGLCLLTNIGIGCGLLLLVVPGLYLAARWSITVPILLGEGLDVTAAMQASAERTRGHVWPIAGLFLLLYLPMIVIVVAAGALDDAVPSLVDAVVVNLALYGTMVTGWFFALALYAALDPRPDRLAEVFA